MGLTVGLVVSVVIASLGTKHLQIDQDFLKAFPDIEKVFPNTRFEFPDRLETTLPERTVSNQSESPGDLVNQRVSHESIGDNLDDTPTITGDGPAALNETQENASVAGYVLQAGAFSERRHAEAFRASLLLEGYNAYTTEHPDEDALARHRVIIGPYGSRQESNEDIARLRQRNISTFLVPLTENEQ